MARNVQAQIEAEADRKGLTGQRREEYIGGAWQRVKHGEERRSWWRQSDEHAALSALGLGEIHELRQPRGEWGRDQVVFRQGKQWYTLPSKEYDRLVREGRQEQRRQAKERQEWERGERIYLRELARIEREDEKERRQAARAERKAERDRAQQERIVRATERAEHEAVLEAIRRSGGIKRYRSKDSHGREYEHAEFEAIPKHVRARKAGPTERQQGVTMDEAAAILSYDMPWLRIETGDDLTRYFERHAEISRARAFRRKSVAA